MNDKLNNDTTNTEPMAPDNAANADAEERVAGATVTPGATNKTDATSTSYIPTIPTSVPGAPNASTTPTPSMPANSSPNAQDTPAETVIPAVDDTTADGAEEDQDPDEKSNGVSVIRAVFTWILIIVAAMFAAWFVRSYVLTPYEIPSGSMEHTLEIGDRVFAERVSYIFTDPKQGDIITFMDPDTKDKKVHRTLIKRVVATEGQTVELIDGTLYVDGEPQTQDYIVGRSDELFEVSPDADLEFPFTVPEDHVFVMGDNRENSADSRYFGAVPIDTIYGHAVITYWPFDRFSLL